MTEFNPVSDYITVRFKCPECGEEVFSDALSVPSPNFAADNNSDSMNCEDYQVSCDNSECGQTFEVTIYNAMFGGSVEVDGVDYVVVDEQYASEDDDYYDYQLYQVTHSEIGETLEAIEPLSDKIKAYLYRLLYANIISQLEAFLSDTIIKQVLSSDENKKKFLQTYEPLAEQKFPMKAIYAKYDALDIIIRGALTSIVYHDLDLVSKIYNNTLGVQLPEEKTIDRAIQIRHHIVHRNGKDKDGNLVEISKESILELAETVAVLMRDIEAQLPNPALNSIKDLLGELSFEG